VSFDPEWSEEAAVDRWLGDLEREATVREVAEKRLEQPPVSPGDQREKAYRERARTWLRRGHPSVALALLERSVPKAPQRSVSELSSSLRPGDVRAQFDLFAAGQPGSAGLPALTEVELEALRAAEEPADAMKVIAAAGRRLQAHGVEARRLLRGYVARKKGR